MSGPSRPQSPGAGSILNMPIIPNQQPAPLVPAPIPGVEVDVITNHIPRESITVERPFKITLTATVSAVIPKAKGGQRVISLAVQHLQCSRFGTTVHSEPPHATETISSRYSSFGGLTSATSTLVTPVHNSPNMTNEMSLVGSPQGNLAHSGVPTMPPPYFEFADQEKCAELNGCVFLGSSTLFLKPITLANASYAKQHEDLPDDYAEKVEGSQEFELTFLPTRAGFVRVGGLRFLLVRDEFVQGDQTTYSTGSGMGEARTLKELDVVAELWVHS